jgi:hypothetical protein
MTFKCDWSDGTQGCSDKLGAADVGKNVSATVTAMNDAGSADATSARVGPVAASSPPPPPPTASFQSLTWITSCPTDAGCLPAPGPSPWNGITEVAVFADAPQATSPFVNSESVFGMGPTLQQNLVNQTHAAGRKALLTFGDAASGVSSKWAAACDPNNRTTTIKTLIDEMQKYGYDGLDVDMEEDPNVAPWSMSSWIGCMDQLASSVNAVKTAAGNTPIMNGDAINWWTQNIWAPVQQDFDTIEIMYYQAGCGGSASCPDIAQQIQLFNGAGIPVNKLMVGQGTEPNQTWPSASDQPDYQNNCKLEDAYLKNAGAAGTAFFILPTAKANDGSWPCFDITAQFVG